MKLQYYVIINYSHLIETYEGQLNKWGIFIVSQTTTVYNLDGNNASKEA